MDPSITYFTYSRRGIEEAAKEEMSKLPFVGISGTTKIHAVIGPEPGFIKTHQLLLVRVFSLKWYLPRGLWGEGAGPRLAPPTLQQKSHSRLLAIATDEAVGKPDVVVVVLI